VRQALVGPSGPGLRLRRKPTFGLRAIVVGLAEQLAIDYRHRVAQVKTPRGAE